MELYKNEIDELYWKSKYMPQNIESLDIDSNIIFKIKKHLSQIIMERKHVLKK